MLIRNDFAKVVAISCQYFVNACTAGCKNVKDVVMLYKKALPEILNLKHEDTTNVCLLTLLNKHDMEC